MNRGLSRAFALSILTVTFASTPALADKGSGSDYFGGRDRGAAEPQGCRPEAEPKKADDHGHVLVPLAIGLV